MTRDTCGHLPPSWSSMSSIAPQTPNSLSNDSLYKKIPRRDKTIMQKQAVTATATATTCAHPLKSCRTALLGRLFMAYRTVRP